MFFGSQFLTREFWPVFMPAERLTLLLLPGLDGTDIFFGPLVRALADRLPPDCAVRVWPLPSQGAQDYATLLAKLRSELADIPSCYVLGWSFSGPLALMLAASEPGKVRGVMLAASFVQTPNPALRHLAFALHAPIVWSWRVLRRLPLWLLRPPHDALRQAKDRTWREVPPSLLAARLREVACVDVRAELSLCHAIGLPLMYIASADDRVVPRTAAQQIVSLHPASRIVTLAGPHQSLYSEPDAAARIIADFVNLVDKI